MLTWQHDHHHHVVGGGRAVEVDVEAVVVDDDAGVEMARASAKELSRPMG